MRLDGFGALAGALRMDADAWARHANPWSVWTRIPVGPLLVLALYARAWIGWWSLGPVAALLAWAWINPRAFPPPARLDSWASRAVLGERRFLARRGRPIPREHLIAAWVTAGIATAGLAVAAWGVVALAPWPAALGTALMLVGKLWFVDRMAWLQDVVGD